MEKRLKKFRIEVEEGNTDCRFCPFYAGRGECVGPLKNLDCLEVNLATMKIKELGEEK